MLQPNADNRMYEVQKERQHDGTPLAEVIPLSAIARSCHLVPKFTEDLEYVLDHTTILDEYEVFFVNDFLDLHAYLVL